jgi:hypothetical protein
VAFCQVERATITGVVTDKANADIDQAIVKIVGEETNQTILRRFAPSIKIIYASLHARRKP